MDIKGTLSNWSSSFLSTAESCGSTVKNCGSSVKSYLEAGIEKGKLGLKTVSKAVQDNPKTTAVAVLATALFAAGVAYNYHSSNNPVPTDGK